MNIERMGADSVRVYLFNGEFYKINEKLKFVLEGLYNENKCSTVILDFENVAIIDSCGLSTILVYQKKFKERNGCMIIRNITSKHLKKMFDLIQLDRIIDYQVKEDADFEYV